MRSPSCLWAPRTGFVLPTDPAAEQGGTGSQLAHLWGGGGLLNRSQLFALKLACVRCRHYLAAKLLSKLVKSRQKKT